MNSDDYIVYSNDELEAMRKAKALLLQEKFCQRYKRSSSFTEDEISKRHLAITTIICKSRPEEAAIKYIEWIRTLSNWGISSLNDDQLMRSCNRTDYYLKFYKLAGKDIHGTNTFWIESNENIPNDLEEEKFSILCGIRYHMAIHSCPKTLREGLTFVINVTNKPKERVGNEKRMQKVNQSYPLRPKYIFIVGASKLMRLTINTLLKIGGIVTKVKILKRIRFATLEEIVDMPNGGSIPKESLPKHLRECNVENNGVESMNIHDGDVVRTHQEEIAEWVNTRIAAIPIPNI